MSGISAAVARRMAGMVNPLVYSPLARLRLKPPRFHPVAAGLHIAPAPRVVLARIEKQPAAGRVTAFLDLLRLMRQQHIFCFVGQPPEGELSIVLGSGPGPSPLRATGLKLALRCGFVKE